MDPDAETQAGASDDDTTLLETREVEIPELAWSASSDAETEPFIDDRSRSRWIGVVVALLIAVTAAAGASGWYVWQHHPQSHTAPVVAPPSAVPAPAPKPESKDDLYVPLLKEHGVPVGPSDVVSSEGRGICMRITNGETEQQLVRDIIAGTPAITDQRAWIWADTAIVVFCPPSQH